MEPLTPLRWTEEGLWILDQRRLPWEETWIRTETAGEVAEAIREMVVRGAPAIGIAAAYGVALAVRGASSPSRMRESAEAAGAVLRGTRPTAVNLAWAVDRMVQLVGTLTSGPRDPASLRRRIEGEAVAIHEEDVAANRRIGIFGADLLPAEGVVLTHCNAGALATGGYGTALGVVRAAVEGGKRIRVLADETRPYLQGARLTAWELRRDGIDVEVICDGMAGSILRSGEVSAVVVGADRIAANGDTANKVGTYPLAVLANRHGVPFYVAAPESTLDRRLAAGAAIPIEARSGEEAAVVGGVRIVPDGVEMRHPAFDVTPGELVTAIVTEAGVFRGPYAFDRRSSGERP